MRCGRRTNSLDFGTDLILVLDIGSIFPIFQLLVQYKTSASRACTGSEQTRGFGQIVTSCSYFVDDSDTNVVQSLLQTIIVSLSGQLTTPELLTFCRSFGSRQRTSQS